MKILLIIMLFIFGGQHFFAQNDHIKRNLNSKTQNIIANSIIDSIETGIANSLPEAISQYLSDQTYLSLLGGVSGYYSSNQVFYILERFFNEYKVLSFAFENIKLNTLIPFATGTYFYEHKGKRSEAEVYITLKLIGKHWKITQLTIN